MIEGGFYPEQPTDSQRKQAYRQSFSGPFARAAHCYLNAALQLLRPTLVWKQSQSYHLAKSLHDFYDNLLDISSLLDILSSELRIRDISRPGDAAYAVAQIFFALHQHAPCTVAKIGFNSWLQCSTCANCGKVDILDLCSDERTHEIISVCDGPLQSALARCEYDTYRKGVCDYCHKETVLHICKAAPHSIGKFIFLKLVSGAEKKVRISSSVLRFWDKAWEVMACSTTGGHAMAFVKQYNSQWLMLNDSKTKQVSEYYVNSYKTNLVVLSQVEEAQPSQPPEYLSIQKVFWSTLQQYCTILRNKEGEREIILEKYITLSRLIEEIGE